jgi:hypothetical protein
VNKLGHLDDPPTSLDKNVTMDRLTLWKLQRAAYEAGFQRGAQLQIDEPGFLLDKRVNDRRLREFKDWLGAEKRGAR